jgi:thioredoxin reductase (NADPH)
MSPRFKATPKFQFFDLVVIGAGPTGLSGAVNGASEGLHTCLVERGEIGGQARHSSRVENYLGFPSGISGPQLTSRAYNQALEFGVECLRGVSVEACLSEGKLKLLTLDSGITLLSRAVLLASGLKWRKLKASNAEMYLDHGVYYGANMDMGPKLRDKHIVVVGGANSAGQASVWFSKFAKKVTQLVRGEKLSTMSEYLIDKLRKMPNVEICYSCEVAECIGGSVLGDDGGRLTHVKLASGEVIESDAMFVFIGAVPHTSWLDGTCSLDKFGFVETDGNLMTRCNGLFAAGDVRSGSIKRIAAGVGEGAMAVAHIHKYLEDVK